MQAYNLACYSSTKSNDQFLFNELFNAFSGSYRKAAIISNVIDNLTSRDESASKITIRQTKQKPTPFVVISDPFTLATLNLFGEAAIVVDVY